MIKALYSTLVEIADSKKAVMAILSVAAALGAKYGLGFDPQQAFLLISPLLVAIAGQAHVDAAEKKAGTPIPGALLTTLAAPAKTPQAGFARLAVMGVIATISVALAFVDLGACKGPTPVPVSDIINCAKLEGGNDWPAIEAKLRPDLDAHNWSQLVADAEALGPTVGLDIASCVAVELVQQYLSTKQVATQTSGAHEAIDKLRVKLAAPGKSVTFHTSAGDL